MIDKIDFKKMNGLVPAVIQDNNTNQVLMVGFMNKEALDKTLSEKRVTFFSRTKNRLWQKGETSGNYLELVSMQIDCDNDTLLIKAIPQGNVCHNNTYTCFGEEKNHNVSFVLNKLEETIRSRKKELPDGSYTTKLFKSGIQRIAQKIGEEGVEVALASVLNDKQKIVEESADLLFHLLVMLAEKEMKFKDITEVLQKRMK